MLIFRLLWRFHLWRYFVIKVLRFGPARLSDWMFYYSGAGAAFEQLYSESGDWEKVSELRAHLRVLEARYGR